VHIAGSLNSTVGLINPARKRGLNTLNFATSVNVPLFAVERTIAHNLDSPYVSFSQHSIELGPSYQSR
jgi:hypothetical protein